MSSDYKKTAAHYLDLKARKEELEAELSDINKQIASAQTDFVFDLTKGGLDAVKALGFTFSRQSVMSVTKTDEDACFDWLESKGYGDSIKRTIHWKTLTRITGEVLKEKGVLPDGVATSTFEVISVRKARKSK